MILDSGRAYPVQTTPIGDGQYRLDINVTNFHDRRQVPNGTWRFVAYIDGEPGPTAGYDLMPWTRSTRLAEFPLRRQQARHTSSPSRSRKTRRTPTCMRAYQMYRRPEPGPNAAKRRSSGASGTVFPGPARVARERGVSACPPAKPPRATASCSPRRCAPRMEGNLARVHDRMVERGLDRSYDFGTRSGYPHTATKRSTLRADLSARTSDIVLIDDYFGLLESSTSHRETKIIQALARR